jgi:hypothetical protein
MKEQSQGVITREWMDLSNYINSLMTQHLSGQVDCAPILSKILNQIKQKRQQRIDSAIPTQSQEEDQGNKDPPFDLISSIDSNDQGDDANDEKDVLMAL